MDSKRTMNSRERVQAALNFQIPDRVPIDLGGFQSGIHKKAYLDLIGYLGLDEEIIMLDPVQQLVRPSETILEKLRVDFRYVTAKGPEGFDGTIRQSYRSGKLWHDLRDEFGVVWSMPDEQQLYMDITCHPLAKATIGDIDSYPFPDGSDITRFKGLREEVLEIRNNTPYAVSTGIGGVVYETCWYLRGLERWFMDMMENPSFCEVLLDKVLQFWLDYYKGFMKEIGDLIDNGIDILNPVQINARDMDPVSLKKRFGRELVFWGGGVDSQHVLPFLDPGEVKANVKANLEAFKDGGGYIFNNVHNIQAGVTPENILAMYEAAYEYGAY